jgi:hypothetical protein
VLDPPPLLRSLLMAPPISDLPHPFAPFVLCSTLKESRQEPLSIFPHPRELPFLKHAGAFPYSSGNLMSTPLPETATASLVFTKAPPSSPPLSESCLRVLLRRTGLPLTFPALSVCRRTPRSPPSPTGVPHHR